MLANDTEKNKKEVEKIYSDNSFAKVKSPLPYSYNLIIYLIKFRK